MRILLLNWRDKTDASYGGAEVVVEKLAFELSKSCDVTLFTSRGSGSRMERRGSIEIIRRGSINTVYFKAAAYLARNRNKYDAVIESVSSVPFFSSLVFDKRRIFVLIPHLMGKNVFKAVNPLKALAAYIAERMIPRLYKGAKFLVLSDFVRRQLIYAGIKPDSIYMIRGYSPSRARPSADKSANPIIVSVGRLVRYKRNDILIRMFAEVHRAVPYAKLVIVGDGPERNKLESLRSSLGLEDCIEFTGFVSEREKDRILSNAWVFTTASRIEGLGLSALEAEEKGLPVVAFGNGGLAEAVRNGYSGFLVKEGDEKAFIDALCRLVGNGGRHLLKNMSAKAIRHAAYFGGREEARDILKIVRDSLNVSEPQTRKPRKVGQVPRGAT
jgi:glycosyltransferase involved in cell wall biosynthesis